MFKYDFYKILMFTKGVFYISLNNAETFIYKNGKCLCLWLFILLRFLIHASFFLSYLSAKIIFPRVFLP